MELIPFAAAIVAVAGAALAAVARTRIALLAGVVAALVLIPLCRPDIPDDIPWMLSALAYLVGTLLGGYLLWVSTRFSGPALEGGRTLPVAVWLALVGALAITGIAGWALPIEWLDPGRGPGARMADWLEAGRWSLGAGLALLAVGLGRLLAAAGPARLAAGTAFGSAGAWLVLTGLGAAPPDVTLPAVGLILPAAAATVAVHSMTRAGD
ncbi:MAG: hypothetical protein H0W00_03675 [Chloroflexi bacterium]|nr:hypothetical protein [Chloroflexota bacterium]